MQALTLKLKLKNFHMSGMGCCVGWGLGLGRWGPEGGGGMAVASSWGVTCWGLGLGVGGLTVYLPHDTRNAMPAEGAIR